MNTNLNEKISENLDAELGKEQLEDVNGGRIILNPRRFPLPIPMPLPHYPGLPKRPRF